MNPSPPSAFDEFREVQAGKKGPGTTGWWETVLPQLDAIQREALLQAAKPERFALRLDARAAETPDPSR